MPPEHSYNDLYKAIYRLLGIVQQAIKQIEDLQDLVQENMLEMGKLADEVNQKKKVHISIHPLFGLNMKPQKYPVPFPKLHPNCKFNNPQQKKDLVLWLPTAGDCTSIAGRN